MMAYGSFENYNQNGRGQLTTKEISAQFIEWRYSNDSDYINEKKAVVKAHWEKDEWRTKQLATNPLFDPARVKKQ